MSDYIKREDVVAACHPVMPTDGVGTIGLTYDEIKAIHAADVVEVVRCKDCKYYKYYRPTIAWCLLMDYSKHDNDYCSEAVRREEADDERSAD